MWNYRILRDNWKLKEINIKIIEIYVIKFKMFEN